MASNLDRYRTDLSRLIDDGENILNALLFEAHGDVFEEAVLKARGGDKKRTKEFIEKLPVFKKVYQAWYSEALSLVKQLLPDRVLDFVRLYEKPKGRKELGFENYRIEDALQGLQVSRLGNVLADNKSAVPHLEQQIAIVKAIERRLDSSLFEIRQLVQADLFDTELDAARELLKNKFYRAAGAIAGVVLEKHLGQVCHNHNVKIGKKHPTIADFNEALKAAGVIDVPGWRFHQLLADIRNLCDHNKSDEPTPDQVKDLIEGVAKVTKTLY